MLYSLELPLSHICYAFYKYERGISQCGYKDTLLFDKILLDFETLNYWYA